MFANGLMKQMNDLQFSVEASDRPATTPEISVSPTKRFVDYQRVCIGGDDTSGVSGYYFNHGIL